MAKKLMAILGANVYKETTYVFDVPGKQKTPYTGYYSTAAVAQVILKELMDDDDCNIVVFLTEEARNNNWEDRLTNYEPKSMEKGKGLRYELMNVALQMTQKAVPINDGKNTVELWSIVNTLLEEIEDGDEVYLDITTGFRSIPLLSLLVINYARTVKNNVRIKGIYYGAFEAKDEVTNHTPIFDLWPMIEVADWSYAIHSFFKHGSAGEISDLLEGSKGNASGGLNCHYLQLGKFLQQFSDNIHMTRGYDLIFNYDYENLKKCMDIIKSDRETGSYPVAKSLIERINNTVDHYINDDVANGFSAVKWCIEHNLIHQGFILLQETVVTCLIVMAGLKEKKHINNYNLRDIFKRAMEIKYTKKQTIPSMYKRRDSNEMENKEKLTLNKINGMVTKKYNNEKIISYLCDLWSGLEQGHKLSDNIKNLIKNEEKRLIEKYGDFKINDNHVTMFVNELKNVDLSRYMTKAGIKSLIDFICKCMTCFAKINGMDIKYSCLMQELSRVRNKLAHGGFNDREISEIIEFRRKWSPDSDLLKHNINKISFIEILKDICENMEDIAEHAR